MFYLEINKLDIDNNCINLKSFRIIDNLNIIILNNLKVVYRNIKDYNWLLVGAFNNQQEVFLFQTELISQIIPKQKESNDGN